MYALAGGNALTVAYLQRRACGITRFGKDIADLNFPQAKLQGATNRQVTDLVA